MQKSEDGQGLDLTVWTRIVLLLAATLFLLQGGDITMLPTLV